MHSSPHLSPSAGKFNTLVMCIDIKIREFSCLSDIYSRPLRLYCPKMIQNFRRNAKTTSLGNCFGQSLRPETHQGSRTALAVVPISRPAYAVAFVVRKERIFLERLQ